MHHSISYMFRGTQPRCSAKHLFHSGNLAGWRVINFYTLSIKETLILVAFQSELATQEQKLGETGGELVHKKLTTGSTSGLL